MESQQSQYMAGMQCQRFVSGHMLFVTAGIRNFLCVTPPPPSTHRKSEIPVCAGVAHRKYQRPKLSAIIYSQAHKRPVVTHMHSKIRVCKGAGGGGGHTEGVVGV